jgi:hypothetical protein
MRAPHVRNTGSMEIVTASAAGGDGFPMARNAVLTVALVLGPALGHRKWRQNVSSNTWMSHACYV